MNLNESAFIRNDRYGKQNNRKDDQMANTMRVTARNSKSKW